MDSQNKEFNDFSIPEDSSNSFVSEAIKDVFQKELTEVEEFKKVNDELLAGADNPKDELTNIVVGYIQAMGDVDQVNVCSYDNGSGVALDGWAFNGDEDMTSIDLFLTIYIEPEKSQNLTASEIDRHFNWLTRFYEQSVNGKMLGKIDDNKSDLYQVADLIHSTEKIDRLRLFMMTNAIAPPNYDKDSIELENGTTCEYVIWDAKRVMRQDNIISGKSPIVVDFESDYNSPLSCIKMPDISENVNCYLCIIPGTVLSQIYHKYHQQILEQNVRTFLQFKGASNKGIRDTMIGHKATAAEIRKGITDKDPEPDMFFAYNNGISTTAAKVEYRKSENGIEITKITDWQIVNGGQTTASISTVLGMKNINISQLSKVFVTMKVSEIKDKERQSAIVQNISRYANTQSAVKKSDFNINEPFLQDIEKQSRQEWVKNAIGKPVNKWFFERTRGQYLDKAKRNPTKAAERDFYAEYPQQQMFDKTQLSKFMMAWYLDPAIVCKGGENCYGRFFTKMKTLGLKFDENGYHRTIAKAILFKVIDAYYGKDGVALNGYKSNMVAYTLAALSHISNKRLDLSSIWNQQYVLSSSTLNDINMSTNNKPNINLMNVYAKLVCGAEHVPYKIKQSFKDESGKIKNHYVPRDIPKEDLQAIKNTTLYHILEFVKRLEPIIWDHIISVDEGQNINEWTKSPGCWDSLKTKLDNLSDEIALPANLLSNESEQEPEINEGQQKVIDEAAQYDASLWFSICNWAKEYASLTPREISFIGQFAFLIKRNRPYTYKQARWALDLLEKAKNAGWEE